MGDSFYHIFTTPYLFFLTLFLKWRCVGIHDVITKIYHMSVITLISGKICDKVYYKTLSRIEISVLGTNGTRPKKPRKTHVRRSLERLVDNTKNGFL
jgi:hypothetical protein